MALAVSCGGRVGTPEGGPSDAIAGEDTSTSRCWGGPGRPTGSAPAIRTRWFAFQTFKLGLSNKFTGAVKPDAWKDYGFNLDCRYTTSDMSSSSSNSCKRRSGSPTKVLADGNGGIDNNFGQHVMAVVRSLKADSEEAINAQIASGGFTVLLRLEVSDGGAEQSISTGALYVAGPLGTTPTFTESDHWPIDSSSLVDGATIGKPKTSFTNGWVSHGYWASGDLGSSTYELPFLGRATVPMQAGVVTVKLSDGTDGTIAGAADTTLLKDAITPTMKAFGICPGNATYDQVVETLTQSADLTGGAPQLQDTSRECNAVSIGVGFTMKPTGEPKVVVSPPTSPDECKP